MAADDDALLAGVAELVDALDLGSSDESCGGSSPSARTTLRPSAHFPKFVLHLCSHFHELRKVMGTSEYLILVPLSI